MRKIKALVVYLGETPREIIPGTYFGGGMRCGSIEESGEMFIVRNETNSALASYPKAMAQATYEEVEDGQAE